MDLEVVSLPELTALCRSLGWISPGTQLSHGQSAGAGNMNRTLRVQLGNRSSDEPETLVLK